MEVCFMFELFVFFIPSIIGVRINNYFNKYLKRQCVKTTFNGLEIESFSWYRKVLGLK